MELLTRNSKMRKVTGVPTFNFGIPAFRSKNGFRTCPYAGKCVKGCFAKGGAYRWPAVENAYEERLAATLQGDNFRRDIQGVIERKTKRNRIAVRIHDSGDFYSPEYLQNWMKIIDSCSDVAFYAYTKSVQWVKDLQNAFGLPENFTPIFSEGGKQDHLIDTDNDRHARVFGCPLELKRAGYSDASSDDSVARTSDNVRIGLVYHGSKKGKWVTG